MRADAESPDTASLEDRLGHSFTDREILRRALTHSSLVHDHALARTEGGICDNEQLEFLGDSILGFLTSEALVRHNPAFREGRLSKLKAHLVSAAHLYDVACRLDLGCHLQLGRGEELSGGRAKKTLLVDALEALIAAIYLDGGIEAARAFVVRHVLDLSQAGDPAQPAVVDFKSALQELAQARRLQQPRYTIVHESGPEHSKTFTVEVRVGKDWSGQAEGVTKKSAAQQAARHVYQRLVSAPPG